MTNNNSTSPSPSPEVLQNFDSAVSLPDLKRLQEVFSQVEDQSSQVAEELFDHLFDVDDFSVINGEIPIPKGKSKYYIQALNRLFKLSRKKKGFGFVLINRKLVKDLDKKTYSFCMCIDGGVYFDVLCEVVNQENAARTPNLSPVKVTIKQFAPNFELENLK